MASVAAAVFSPDSGDFAPEHRWDRNFFLLYVALIWTGVVMGFGGEIIDRIHKHQANFPLIVHFHAAAFVGWLALLTTQVFLIRAGRVDIHRRLGLAGVALAAIMVVIGPATALYMGGVEFGTPRSDPPFLAIQFTDILAFAGLVTAAIALRGLPSAHKRLILLATLYISDAGFGRWLGGSFHAAFGDGFWGMAPQLYFANDLLIVGLGVYDLVTRRRLHPVYVVGVVWVLANQFTADWLYHSPLWKPVSLWLIGH